MKKIAIYCRVSTAMQEKEKTIESQLAELREVCKDFEIVKEYIDENWSGEVLARPALDQLRDDASTGLFEALYIHNPDRLARKYAYQVLILEELKKEKIEVVFLNRPVSDNPEDQLLLGVQGLISEYEKAKILERTRRGRLRKARNGFVVGSNAPYGYNYVKRSSDNQGYYEINKKEAEVVKLVFSLYQGIKSVRGVAKELTKMGIKPRKGVSWRTSTLHTMLRNESYIGTTYYNKSKGVAGEDDGKYKRRVNSRREFRDKSQWLAIKISAIVSNEIFGVVQSFLAEKHNLNNRKYSYLLGNSIIKCKCGSPYAGENSHGKLFYRCNNRHKKFPLPKDCNAKMIGVDKMDSAVFDALEGAMVNPNIMIKGISLLVKNTIGNKRLIKKEQITLLSEKERLRLKRNKLVEIYTEGGILKDMFLQKTTEINDEEKKLDEKIRINNERLSQVVDKPLFIRTVKHFCKIARQRLRTLDLEKKRDIVKYLIDSIIYDSYKREALVSGYIPIAVGQSPLHQQVMSSSCGYLQGSLGIFLSFYPTNINSIIWHAV